MFNRMAEFIVRVCDLAEAEGRELRAAMGSMSIGLAFLFAATLLGSAGAVIVAAAIFFALRQALGAPGAAAISGVVCLGVAAWLFVTARKLLQ